MNKITKEEDYKVKKEDIRSLDLLEPIPKKVLYKAKEEFLKRDNIMPFPPYG